LDVEVYLLEKELEYQVREKTKAVEKLTERQG
jgi:hypothetical protein